MSTVRGEWGKVPDVEVEYDVTEHVKFGLRWWTGRKTTMNWFTIGPMRVDDQFKGKIVGVMVTVVGRVYGVSINEWWT